jgi:hypothetical protein
MPQVGGQPGGHEREPQQQRAADQHGAGANGVDQSAHERLQQAE